MKVGYNTTKHPWTESKLLCRCFSLLTNGRTSQRFLLVIIVVKRVGSILCCLLWKAVVFVVVKRIALGATLCGCCFAVVVIVVKWIVVIVVIFGIIIIIIITKWVLVKRVIVVLWLWKGSVIIVVVITKWVGFGLSRRIHGLVLGRIKLQRRFFTRLWHPFFLLFLAGEGAVHFDGHRFGRRAFWTTAIVVIVVVSKTEIGRVHTPGARREIFGTFLGHILHSIVRYILLIFQVLEFVNHGLDIVQCCQVVIGGIDIPLQNGQKEGMQISPRSVH
mmetsp:Transcript_5324/g.14998  ORF Transcript_5324/g.14998 Transcript_5324/m.14998 type:complete len:275 (+) Transcript_5324:613-1437(+)